jgi:hypothetical protein
MAVLAYAVANQAIQVTAEGVAGAPASHIEIDGLHAWYAQITALPDDVQTNALRFHAAIGDLFRQTAIVPFRFPTMLADEAELVEFVRDRHELFAADLARLAGKVQMEVIIAVSPPSAPETGTAYMQGKLDQSKLLRESAERIRTTIGTVASETAERDITNGVRMFFLVTRGEIDKFMQAIAQSGVRGLRTTGPWPPTAFLSKELAAAHV